MNTDKLTTYLGLAQGIGVAVGTYITTASQDGTLNWSNPVTYIGIGIAVLMAVKAFFTKGIENKPAEGPSSPVEPSR